jgi:excisionase family DNA binding protein
MERLLTTEEVAELLRIDPVTVRRLVTRGELAASRIAGEYRFSPTDVEHFVEGQRVVVKKFPESMPFTEPLGVLPNVGSTLARVTPVTMPQGSKPRFDRFTERARTVLTLTHVEVTQYKHVGMSTEHMLLAIMEEGSGVGAEALRRLQVQPHMVREQIEESHSAGREGGDQTEPGMTSHLKAVIELAVEEARLLNHQYIGTEHLLLGLLRESEGLGGQVLLKSGVALEQGREMVKQLLAEGATDE